MIHDYYYNGSVTWVRNISASAFNELRLTLSRRQTLSISAGANTTIDKSIGLTGANQSFFPVGGRQTATRRIGAAPILS